MFRVYKDAPTRVDLLRAGKALEMSVKVCSPLIHGIYRTMMDTLKSDDSTKGLNTARKLATLISYGGRAGAFKEIAKVRLLAKGLGNRIGVYAKAHPKVVKEVAKEYSEADIKKGYDKLLQYSKKIAEIAQKATAAVKAATTMQELAKAEDDYDYAVAHTSTGIPGDLLVKVAEKYLSPKYGIDNSENWGVMGPKGADGRFVTMYNSALAKKKKELETGKSAGPSLFSMVKEAKANSVNGGEYAVLKQKILNELDAKYERAVKVLQNKQKAAAKEMENIVLSNPGWTPQYPGSYMQAVKDLDYKFSISKLQATIGAKIKKLPRDVQKDIYDDIASWVIRRLSDIDKQTEQLTKLPRNVEDIIDARAERFAAEQRRYEEMNNSNTRKPRSRKRKESYNEEDVPF